MQTVTIPMEELAQILRLQLDKAGKASLIVTGRSMRPTLRQGLDRVILVRPETKPKRSDVILYQRANGSYVLHRIVRVTGEAEYICSGDNQWQPEPVSLEQVVAVVESFYRKEKLYSLKNPVYRIYVWLWVFLFPVRRPVLALRRRIGKVYYGLRKKLRRKTI